ncbi:hypothetical protein HYS97_03250 [Candidatus Daviesbacteria bacterium]|nr:hypothetical protein [Candidatus Daviesbacteria bacterium]
MNKKNISGSGTLPSNFGAQADDDRLKHEDLKRMDEQIEAETGSLGSMPEEVMDIDETAKSVGLETDENGLKELNSADNWNNSAKSD